MTHESLALKYRPQNFDDLVGQRAVQVILRQMVRADAVPHALLFDGSRGTGKTTTARIVAAALNCRAENAPCGTCVSCTATFDGSSMDVIEIDAASNGLVDDIRAMRQQVMYRQSGDYRVVIYDEAQSISNAGYNALLKMLEEPPPQTVFILLTTEPGKILDTVVSRCMRFTFRRLTVADMGYRLGAIAALEAIEAESDLLMLLAERADGAMRDAIMLLDQVSRVGISTAEQYQRLIGHRDDAPEIIQYLVQGKIAEAFAHLEEALTRVADAATIATDAISVLRDVLVLRCGGEIHKSGTALAIRQNLALALETHIVLAALKVLWQLMTQIRLEDSRSMLELAVVMLSEVFHATPAHPAPAPGRLSLTDMARFQ